MRSAEAARCAWFNLTSVRSSWATGVVVTTLTFASAVSLAALGLIAGKHRIQEERLAREPLGKSIVVGSSFNTSGRFDREMVDRMTSVIESEADEGRLAGVHPFVATNALSIYRDADDEDGFPADGRTARFDPRSTDPIFDAVGAEDRARLPQSHMVLSREFLTTAGMESVVAGDQIWIEFASRRIVARVAGIVDESRIQGFEYIVSETTYFELLHPVLLREVTIELEDSRALRPDEAVAEKLNAYLAERRLSVLQGPPGASTLTLSRTDGGGGYDAVTWKARIQDFLAILSENAPTALTYRSQELERLSLVEPGPFDFVCFTFESASDLESGKAGIDRFEEVRDYVNQGALNAKIAFDKELADALSLAAALCLGVGAVLAVNIWAFQYLRFKDQSAEIGLLRAIGFSAWDLLAISASEAAAIWCVGIIAGTAIGYVGGAAMAAHIYAAEPRPLSGFASPSDFFVHILVVGFVTLGFYSVSVLLAALRSVRLDPARLMADP